MINLKLNKIYDLFFKKEYYILYVLTLIHLIIILYTLLDITGYRSNVYYKLTLNPYSTVLDLSFHSISETILLLFEMYIIDFVFFGILYLEFKQLKLTFKKIFIIDTVIIFISFWSPQIRDIMFFMSFNSLQMFVYYYIIKSNYLSWLKIPIMLSLYIVFVQLIIYPWYELLRLVYLT